MVEEIKTRVSKKLKKAIEEAVKLRGYASINEFMMEAAEEKIKGDRVKQRLKLDFIPLSIDCECDKCHRKIPAFEWAWYGTAGIFCQQCSVEKHGDKRTAKMAFREREQKYKLKAVKHEIERMLDIYEEVNFVGHASDVLEKNKKANESNAKVIQRLSEFLAEIGAMGYEKERQNFEELMRYFEDSIRDREDVRRVLNGALEILNKLMRIRQKKKREKKKEEIYG